MTNIETREGWQPSGPCFTRVYDGKFAVIDPHPSSNLWWCRIHASGQSEVNGEYYMPLPEAVAWANDVLGVPKPVEVVEEKFADGSYVFSDKENTRWATVSKALGRWYLSTSDGGRAFGTEAEACEASREYVRGAA